MVTLRLNVHDPNASTPTHTYTYTLSPTPYTCTTVVPTLTCIFRYSKDFMHSEPDNSRGRSDGPRRGGNSPRRSSPQRLSSQP